MERILSSINSEILQHGEITLQPLYPKIWEKIAGSLSFARPDARDEHSIEVTIPSALPEVLKENLVSLIQAVCYRHHLALINVTEKEGKHAEHTDK